MSENAVWFGVLAMRIVVVGSDGCLLSAARGV